MWDKAATVFFKIKIISSDQQAQPFLSRDNTKEKPDVYVVIVIITSNNYSWSILKLAKTTSCNDILNFHASLKSGSNIIGPLQGDELEIVKIAFYKLVQQECLPSNELGKLQNQGTYIKFRHI